MYKTLNDVTTASLKKHCTHIHYFGLGFIQVKLGATYRMHFYTPELPAITGEEDVHNHRYGFTSRILSGVFEQDIFTVGAGNTHVLEEESCKVDVQAESLPRPCTLSPVMTQYFTQGSHYHITHDAFHRVQATDAITLLKRGPIEKELAEVVRPVGEPSICPFSKKIAEERLWSIITGMLRKRNGV